MVLIWITAVLLMLATCMLFLAVIVVSIHRVDHAKALTRRPRGRADAMTRRLLGIRASSSPARRRCSWK